MILVGNPRGGAKNLAQHLMKEENDHVTVHELRGFASDNLDGALNEAYAVSRGTRCQQFLFSLSLNPPSDAKVETESFERAINHIEGELGLSGQPRAIVFHEKEGRRHAHAVWSRINAQTMTAKPLPFHKNKLQDVARELYREHGWKMPEGFAARSKSDPRSFTLDQWQQAKRIDKDPREIKDAISDAWAISDSKTSFTHALKERGYWLARGDRRGFTAMDAHGEIYSIPRQAGIKTKAVRERLGNEDDLPSIETAKADMAHDMQFMLTKLQSEQERKAALDKSRYEQTKFELVSRQRDERQAFDAQQQLRREQAQQQRQAEFRSGFKGLWDKLRGEHKRLVEQHRLEQLASQARDREQRDALVFRQLESRKAVRLTARNNSAKHHKTVHELQRDSERYHDMIPHNDTRPFPNAPDANAAFSKAADQKVLEPAHLSEARRQFNAARKALSDRPQQTLEQER